MKRTKSPLKLVEFDVSWQLKDGEAIAEYMRAVLEADDPGLPLLALGDAELAEDVAGVAKDVGLSRVGLYRALGSGRQTSL